MSGSEGFSEWEMVVTRDNHLQQGVFPPMAHEDLQVQLHPSISEDPNCPLSSSSSSVSSVEDKEDSQPGTEVPAADDGAGRCRFEVIRAWIFDFGSKVRECAVSGVRFWPVVSVVAAVLVSVLYRKVRQWRGQLQEEKNRRFAILIRDRDEKINRLLLQVARANKLLSARQSQRQRVPVPVIRVRTG